VGWRLLFLSIVYQRDRIGETVRQSNSGFVKIVRRLLVQLAILLHATWNGTATYGGAAGFFAGYFIIMGPAFIITLMVIFFLRREGRIVRQFLYSYRAFDAIEYEKLCTIRGRMGLSWNAMTGKGSPAGAIACVVIRSPANLVPSQSRCQNRSRSGLAQEREEAFLHALLELRQKLGAGAGAAGQPR
jgi:hypothetical protein